MKIKEITKLVDDLFWDYDRLTSSGKETLDKLGDVLGIEAYTLSSTSFVYNHKEENEDSI